MAAKKKVENSIELEIYDNKGSEEAICPICGKDFKTDVPKWFRIKGKSAVCSNCAKEHNFDLYSQVGIADIFFEVKEMVTALEADDCHTAIDKLYSLSSYLNNNLRWIDEIAEKKALRYAQKLAHTGIVFERIIIHGVDIFVDKKGFARIYQEIPF